MSKSWLCCAAGALTRTPGGERPLEEKEKEGNWVTYLPSSITGVPQYAHLTLHGSVWFVFFPAGSYHPRS